MQPFSQEVHCIHTFNKDLTMKLIKPLLLGFLLAMSVSACQDDVQPIRIEVTGTIQEQGITTYQYGTHTISGYALKSETINLDDYVNQNVTIVGYKIDGYPVDGGPDYIEVEEIK